MESGGTKSVNRDLEAKSRAVAGLKGYITNLTDAGPEFVIDAYHQLWRIEKSFRMSTHGLQARPIYHRKRESIEAHLTIVFAALAVSNWIEHQTGWSIKKFVPPPATTVPCSLTSGWAKARSSCPIRSAQ
jgi:transposase